MNHKSPKSLELLDESFEFFGVTTVKEKPVVERIQVPEENTVYADYPSRTEGIY